VPRFSNPDGVSLARARGGGVAAQAHYGSLINQGQNTGEQQCDNVGAQLRAKAGLATPTDDVGALYYDVVTTIT
jgi:hypothetical protein